MRKCVTSIPVLFITFLIGTGFSHLDFNNPNTNGAADHSSAVTLISTPAPAQLEYSNVEKDAADIEREIWSGYSSKTHIRWTTSDIYIQNGSRTRSLYSDYTAGLFEKNYKYEWDYDKNGKTIKNSKRPFDFKGYNCSIYFDGEIASVVGPYLTIETETLLGCGILQTLGGL